jgi:hypothetical protein
MWGGVYMVVLGVNGCYFEVVSGMHRGLAPWPPHQRPEVGQNVRMEAQTSIATILEFPVTRSREPWVPRHARPCTVDDVESYSLKLIQHLCNVTCRPVTFWPSDRYGQRWAGREAWVTCGQGRTREVPADTARGSTPLMTLLPRHYHMQEL